MKGIRSLQATVALFVMVLFAGSALALPPAYELTDLGLLDSTDSESRAVALNNLGQVVGWSDYNNQKAFLWDNGTMTPLGSLLGRRTIPYGVNDGGQVVGFSETDGYDNEAFLWQNGQMTNLTVGTGIDYPLDINNAGQIVGSEGSNAVLVQNGQVTVLGPGLARAINQVGEIVGENPQVGFSRPVRFVNGQVVYLPTLPGTDHGAAYDINDHGVIVGLSISNSGDQQATLWQDGQPISLEVPGIGQSWVYAINNQNQVVGNLSPSAGGASMAFIWEDGELYPLFDMLVPSSGWSNLTRAVDINDQGQITGWGWTLDGRVHAYLLTPVPEPATLGLLAFGGLALLRRRRR